MGFLNKNPLFLTEDNVTTGENEELRDEEVKKKEKEKVKKKKEKGNRK